MRPNVLLYGTPSTVEVSGAPLRIKTDWRVWVRVQMLMDDPEVPDRMASSLLLDAVYPRRTTPGEDVPPYEAATRSPGDAVDAAIWFARMGVPERPQTAEERRVSRQRTWDWGWDSAPVVADFQRFYGIDLTDPGLRMHWWRFWSLFCGLGEDSESVRVMAVRAADGGKLKGEEKRRLAEAKQRTMLPARTEEERRRNTAIRFGV
ncbi:hypothetical protein B5F40_01765 [Gordonibacter sp. An230]|uniref:Gp15 family bacteriophage protein n=1 Tax=Gordonibacter sp. An230 TaxID=1965592 RepID=UPI000B36FCDF|nr:Gp15 family bacteriophage protein [Gordonibacter sp. An230]OUO92086.1 hypothetical protein B5F40_01765 [Gordonibacter sp. An230]